MNTPRSRRFPYLLLALLLLLCPGPLRAQTASRPTSQVNQLLDFKITTNITTLRAFTPPASGQRVYVTGYAADGDGGGGWFTWSASSTATVDNGTVFQRTGSSSGRWLRIVDGPLNPLWWGAKRDGITDDRTALLNTFAAAVARSGAKVLLPRGTYKVTKYVPLMGATNVSIEGESGAAISYPNSATATAETYSGVSLSDTQVRSAIWVYNSSQVTVRDLAFYGDPVNNTIAQNTGCAVYGTQCDGLSLLNVRNFYGGSLFRQDNLQGTGLVRDRGARLIGCTSYGARLNVNPCDDTVISACRFELPNTPDYNRINSTTGSSHAIYIFAGRQNVVITGCTFKNIRVAGIKASGSSQPLRAITISACTFDDCGIGCELGADDYQEHAAFSVTGCTFMDCGTNVSGWAGQAIAVLGSRGITITGNQFHWRRACAATVGSVVGIGISRYQSAGRTVSDAAMTNGSITLTSATANFQTSDVGTLVSVGGAGSTTFLPLQARIVARTNSTTVSLSTPASNTVSNAACTIGYGTPVHNIVIANNSFTGKPGRTLTDAVMSANSATLTSATGNFASGTDILERVVVIGAGPGGGNLVSAIKAVNSSTSITLEDQASTAVSGATCHIAVPSPGMEATYAIQVSDIGAGTSNGSSCAVRGNEFYNCCGVAVGATRCTGLSIENNTVVNVVTAFALQGNRVPRIRNNFLVIGPATSSNAQLRLNNDGFPIITGNGTGARNRFTAGNTWSVGDGNAGSTSVDFPICGTRGRAMPTDRRPEVVFAFGDGWVNGDWVLINGVTYTYKSSSPGAGQFNSAASLISAINTQSQVVASDYGASFATPVTTNHIRVRWATTSTTANQFSVTVNAIHPCAGLILANGTGANAHRCFSRGETASANNVSVVWSPLTNLTTVIQLYPDNAAAQTLLQTSLPLQTNRGTGDEGSDAVLTHAPTAATPATEEFRYLIGGAS